MIWTEQLPSTPGWYWEKHPDGLVRIMYYPRHGQYPKPWQERLKDCLEAANDDEQREQLKELNWVVKYAGPIPEPTEA